MDSGSRDVTRKGSETPRDKRTLRKQLETVDSHENWLSGCYGEIVKCNGVRRQQGGVLPRIEQMLDRRAHLLDLENMVGAGHVTEAEARLARDIYIAAGLVAVNDQVIVGVSHHNAFVAKWVWPSARVVVTSGPDGADLALQEVMEIENLHTRFGSAILVTGDGGFAHPVATLIGRGLPVGVIAPRGRLSRVLKLAATASCEIDFTPTPHTSRSA